MKTSKKRILSSKKTRVEWIQRNTNKKPNINNLSFEQRCLAKLKQNWSSTVFYSLLHSAYWMVCAYKKHPHIYTHRISPTRYFNSNTHNFFPIILSSLFFQCLTIYVVIFNNVRTQRTSFKLTKNIFIKWKVAVNVQPLTVNLIRQIDRIIIFLRNEIKKIIIWIKNTRTMERIDNETRIFVVVPYKTRSKNQNINEVISFYLGLSLLLSLSQVSLQSQCEYIISGINLF